MIDPHDDPRNDDHLSRAAIHRELGATLFVEAGAGSGKTTSLVGRIIELVASGEADVRSVAAITFTEAAAAELRDRVREALERMAAGDVDDLIDPDHAARTSEDREVRAGNAAAAIADVDAAAISTLHSFSQRILREHPLEVGLPPGIVVLDELASAVEFNDRWDEFFDKLLEAEEYQDVVMRALVAGIKPEHLRTIASAFNDNWDLAEDADLDTVPLGAVSARPVLEALHEARSHMDRCVERDGLLDHLEGLAGFQQRLEGLAGSDLETLEMLRDAPKLKYGRGAIPNWSGVKPAEIRALLTTAQEARDEAVAGAGREALASVLVLLRRLTLDAADERRREGRLEFHDLLVLARDLLRHRPEIAESVRARYTHLLIDEFQDTDPIQAELAVRIAAPGAGADAGWRDLGPEDGRLFFVGDPKQSIYRFRRADIELFLDVRNRLVTDALQLTRNFRSVPGIIDWVNAVFGELFEPDREPMQPAYVELMASREAHDAREPVVLLGAPIDAQAGVVRGAAADDIARAIRRVVGEGWPVGADGKPARLGDIAILLPTRTGMEILTDTLERHEVPYRIEASSLVYQTDEVRDLLATLRAVDDPTDQVSIVASLRSPLFGCGDDDLVRWFDEGGKWDYTVPAPDDLPVDDPVRRSMADLAELHGKRWWTDVSSLIEEVLHRRRVLELALDTPRPRDVWRRLRFVADQARAFAESSGSDLRRWLAWVELLGAEDARVTETVLPEADDDAVRILTVHGSKGLEFPVVFLAGLGSPGRHSLSPVLWDKDGRRPEVKVGHIATAGYVALAEREQEMEDFERLRLLYVAATRARDHLFVSLHHKAGTKSHAATLDRLCEARPDLWRRLEESTDSPVPPERSPHEVQAVDDHPAARRTWLTERAARLEAAKVPRAVAPTALARQAWEAEQKERHEAATDDWAGEPAGDPGLAKDEPDLELPPWRRGRAGTAIGRAVHGTLQFADLESGDDIGPLAAAQAAAEGVADRAGEVERLARVALDAPIVRQAVESGRFWREIYVGAPVGGRVLEGFVDLLVEHGDQFAVVDYKTDQAATDEELDAKLDRYRIQGAAYALAIERTLDRPVTRCVFVFLRPDGAVQKEVADLDEAKARAEELLTHGE